MTEPAIKAHLKSISIERGVSFNEIWKQFLLERFLARLSLSKHHRIFIFKGGLLLAQYLPIGRETTDADFLTKGINNDALLIVRSPHLLDSQKTGEALRATFKNRGTILSVPITFDNAGMETLQNLWTGHLRSLGNFKEKLELPLNIGQVLEEINQWLSEKYVR